MRIVFLVVFYIAIYVAIFADGDETTKARPENDIKHIVRKKNGAIRDEQFINDEMTLETNKRRGQSLLINRIDSLSQNRRILNDKLARVKRSLWKRKKHARDSDIAHRNVDVDDDEINEEEDSLSAKTRGLPIWQVSEPTVAAIDLNYTNPMTVQTKMINRSSLKRPRSGNLSSHRFLNGATSLIAERHPNSRGLSDTNVSKKNLVFSKFPNSRSNIKSPSVLEKLTNKISLSAYPSEISADRDSPSRRFEWQRNGYRKDPSNSYIKEDLFKHDDSTGSNERFLLIPVSRDLYVLKNIQDTSKPNTDGMTIPKHYKLLERNKNKGNASTIISFKAHMHHDAKDVGKAYLHHRDSNNDHLSDYNANYLYTDPEPRVIEERTENLTPLSYPNFLYPGIAFQTRPDLVEAIPEIVDQQITLPDYKYISSVDIDSNTEIAFYDTPEFPSTSPKIPNYDISLYPKENANNRQSNVLPAKKLDELNLRQNNGDSNEKSLDIQDYNELNIESTTNFQDTFGTLDDEELFEMSKNIEDDFKLSTENERLNKQDRNKNNIEFGITISNEYSDKKSASNNFNYDNKFNFDETSFSNYTTVKLDSFLNVEDYTTSASLLSDTDEWSLKKKQSNVGNPRALLKAIEPLSSELKKLLTAVKLVNQSISNVQNRLCDNDNVVRSTRIERENQERKSTNIAESINRKDNHFDLFTGNFDNQSLNKKQIKIKDKSIVDRTSNVELNKKKIINDYFLNKLMTPLQRHEKSINRNRKIRNNQRNFLKKRRLKLLKPDNIEKHRLPHLRFNRNLKSLEKDYKIQTKPIRQFVEPGLKRVIITTTMSSHRLMKNKHNFINGHTRDPRGNKSFSSSDRNIVPFADEANRVNFLSNNKRDLARYNVTSKLFSDEKKKHSPVDPQSYREVTAYFDILRLLNMTKKPYTARVRTTATTLPYPIESSTTSRTRIAWTEESPEMTESVLYEYLTGTDYEYYEQNYTKVYKDYEERGNVTSWYDYMEETTTEKKETTTTIEDLISKFVETARGIEITTPVKEKIDYEVVETISLIGLSVTLSAFTITMPTTLSQFYTTELPIFPITEEIFITEITEETIAMPTKVTGIFIPTTIELTTESVMLLTPFFEGLTDITLRITIPAVTSGISIEETPMTTEKDEIVESTSITLTTEMTQSFFAETSTSFTISTVSSITSAETAELTTQIRTSTIPVLTSISVTERIITITSEFSTPTSTLKITEGTSLIAEKIKTTSIKNITTESTASTTQFTPSVQVTESTIELSTISKITVEEYAVTAITSSPTISERTETILSTLTETVITTLTPEEESPVTQIEKTITAGEMTTETPITIETQTTTEIIEISTLNETTTIEISSITSTETLLTVKTTMTKIPTPSGISTISATLLPENRTITQPLTTIEISTKIPITATSKTSIITETIESTSTSSVIPISVTAIKTVPTTLLTLMTTKRPATTSVKTTVPITSLKLITTTSVTNITLRETPYVTISSTFLTTTIAPVTQTTSVKTTSLPLKLTTIMPLFPVTNTTLSETPSTISTTFSTEEIETTTFSITSILTSTLLTTTPFLSTINETLFTTIFTTFKMSTTETTFTTMSPFEMTLTSTTGANTTLSEVTFSTFSTEIIEATTSITALLTEKVSTTSLTTELTMEEEVTVNFTTITEETSIKEINVTSTTVEISEPTNTTLTFTEKSTTPAIETSIANTSLASTMTTVSLLRETTAEASLITTTATSLLIIETSEETTILKTEMQNWTLPSSVEMTFTPLPEFTSVLITSETPATTSEVTSVLPEIVSEEREFTILTSPSMPSTSESFTTLFIETTIQPIVSTLAATTKEIPEVETEYYITKTPFEEEYEEYEECDTEIPDEWHYYEEYETTVKIRTTVASSTAKYTKLFEETATGPPFEGTSSYETFEFTTYSTISTSIYTPVISTTTRIPYTYTLTSALETSAMTITENITTVEAGVELTSVTSKEEESTTTTVTFGSTEEYTLLPSTVFEIITKPLEHLTISAKYTKSTSKFLTPRPPKFTTKAEVIPEMELEKTSTFESILTETEFTAEKLTSIFVSSTLTTLSEIEAIGVTTASSAEMETEIPYEVTTLTTMSITKEEIETEFITAKQTTIGRDAERKQLVQLLEYLEQRERELAEREERLKEKERKWEEKKRKEMMQREKEKANVTLTTGTTATFITTTIIETIPVGTVSIQNLTATPTAEIKVTPLILETSSLAEIITISTETTTPLYIAEEGTLATYITEKAEETTTKGSIFPTYTVTEEITIFYTTEESTTVTYVTKETEEIYTTNYTTVTSYTAAPIVDLYNISLVSIETTTSYTTEEMYTTSYETVYLSEPLFTFSTMMFTSPITLAVEFTTLPTIFSISSYEIGATSITIPTRITTESYTTSYVTLSSELPFISITTPILYTTEETIEIYSEPLFTSPASVFIQATFSTTPKIVYDEEIENLREKLREKERELEEKERILLEREEKLERDRREFEQYMKELEKEEMHTLIALSEKPIVSISLSTPVPPTEKTTTIKVETIKTITTIKKETEKKGNQTTTKMVTPRYGTAKEEEQTRYLPEKTVTQIEEEIATKRICLNVLENTTVPFVIKKMCLPYFPEKTREQKSVDRLSRKLLSLSNTRDIRGLKFQNLSSNVRYRGKREAIETTRKINNLQLLYHEWLNEITKPMRHFKGFTRIYKKKGKSLKKIDMRKNSTHNFPGKTLYEQRILDPYESLYQPTAKFIDNKKYGRRNAFFHHNLIPIRRNNFSNNDKRIEKRNVLSKEKNTLNQKTTNVITEKMNSDEKENESYTVNVLHLSYNKDRETHEVISAKPNENELIMMSESNDNNVTKFEEDGKITAPYYDFEEKNDLQEADDLQKEEKLEDDSFEDTLENYINYEERTTSIPTSTRDDKFLDERSEDERKMESKTKSTDQVWPTEKNTAYHLGGTRFWELEFTEPSSVSSIATDKSKTIDVSITRTTCLYVVLKNEINTDATKKMKRNTHYRKRNVYNNQRRRYNISAEKRKIGLKNVTRKNSQNLRKLKQNSRGKRKLDEFNEDSIIAKTRKLCSVNENEPKHQIIKYKGTTNIKDKTKEKQSAKSQNINSRSPKSCTDSCNINKKNSNETITRSTANHYSEAKSSNDKETDEKVVNTDVTAGHKNQSKCVSRERKNHDYVNCICDIVSVIENVKSILNRISFSVDEIKTLNCNVYKEIQNKIVISMNSDAEEAREFSQPHYNTESLKGQKYIKLEELEDDFKNDLELGNDHDIVSLPGLNLNLPCNQDGDGITWLSSISRPSYTWKRTDGIAIFGFVAENGDLELRNVNAKDTGNYTCITTYMGPETEEPVETTYEVRLQVVTLPRYIVHGENRYYTRSCDERDLDILVTYLPVKLNDIICEADICNAYILTPSCSRSQITVNILLLPSHVVKLMTIDPKHCNVYCLKAVQDKLSLILSKNLQIFFRKTIIFRLPHYEQRLVPIAEKSTFARWKRGRTDAGFAGRASNIGLFSSCPAGYGLRGTHCVPCNMGTYSEDGISHCKNCPPGTYQPNHGARICRTCTDPLTKGCHNMLWSSFSAIMVTLASLGVIFSICLLFLWLICCAKKKFCIKKIASIIPKEDTVEQEDPLEEQSLIKDASESQDQWDNEYKTKKRKKKFHLNKKRRKQNERGKYEKMRVHEDEWGSHRTKNIPIICPDSYRSHEDYNNYYSKQSYHKGPRLPECDFDT